MDIKLKDLLIEKRSSILKKWFDAIIETYPTDTSGFLKKQKDRFANPVGHTISQGTESILEALIVGKDLNEGPSYLEDIIKVRAIQDFKPAKAISFIFLLKKVVREELEKEIRQKQIYDALLIFESKVDDLALLAFNIYTECREQLNQVKIDELKRMTFTLMKKANLMYDVPAQEFELETQKCNI
jgi:hypothetical protein